MSLTTREIGLQVSTKEGVTVVLTSEEGKKLARNSPRYDESSPKSMFLIIHLEDSKFQNGVHKLYLLGLGRSFYVRIICTPYI